MRTDYDTALEVLNCANMLAGPSVELDPGGVEYLIRKCRAELLADIHQKEVPEGLFYTLVDMAAAAYLLDKLASGTLEIEGLNFSAQPKSITEGDVSVTFGSGGGSPEAQFRAKLERMARPPESVLSAYRRLLW